METTLLPKWMLQILGVLLILLLACLIVNQVCDVHVPPQTLRVSGIGKAIAIPDVATVVIGVATEGSTPEAVRDQNNQKMNQIISFVKGQNIDARDIQTTNLNASPKYNYDNGQNNIVGYQANQTITIKVKQVDKSQRQLETIIAGVVSSGANQIQGVDFSFSDTDKLKQSARKLAIQQAKQNAKDLTHDAGIRLGRVINVEESSSDNAMPYPRAMAMSAKNQAVSPTIEPGTQEMTETVTLVFELP